VLVKPLLYGKALSIAYSECLFVAYDIQYKMRMLHFVTCGLPGSTIFFHSKSQTAQFSKKKKVIEYKMCFDFLCQVWLKHFSFQE
jgi:hypothetical protein